MIETPPYLEKGDTIGIVCPSGYMPVEKASECIRVLNEEWGFRTKVGKTLGNQFNYFSGTDEERLNDFQQMLDDDEVKAILCARGGYGLSRIIDKINFKKFKKQPKWIIGYSDVTILHSHLFNKKGQAIGELIGGNLSLLAHLIGTDSDIKTRGRILFLEDVGEYFYNIDRMMYQLKRSGKLSRLAGLIIGGFTESKDTERPFGQTAYEIIHDVVKDYDYPICFGFPVSHGKENYALKIGVGYKLEVRKSKIILEE